MPLFSYKALNPSGQSYEATFEGPDRFSVYRKVKADGDTVVYVHEAQAKEAMSFAKIFNSIRGIKMYEKIIFARNLASMIEAGLSVTRALAVMEKQTKNAKMKFVLTGLNDDISKGTSLSESMKKRSDTFSPIFVSMVRSGEESGNLSGALKTISIQMEKTYTLTKKVKGALMYPAVIFGIMIVIAILMLIFMVPTLTATFQGLGIQLPLSTRIIVYVSDFLRFHYFIFLFSVATIVTVATLIFKSPQGKKAFDYASTRFPVFGPIVREINSARTARTLSSLMSSGVDIVVALGVTQDVLQNSYYRKVITEAQECIERGEPISSVFIKHENLYPIFVGEMISVGEETGKMADMLLGVATFYEDEVDQKTKNMSTLIEPFLMVFMGAAVGFFAVSMLAPTYSLVDAI